MTHILLIWTVIACSHSHCKYDWRPMGEFYTNAGTTNSKALCEDAAKSMALKVNEYRCVRSK